MKNYVDTSDGVIEEHKVVIEKLEQANTLSCKLELEDLIDSVSEIEESIEDANKNKAKIIKDIRERMLEKHKISNDSIDKDKDFLKMGKFFIFH